ncbi:MAG: transporter substrate-binding domain-containing protein [Actinomycetota bacterium]
MRRTWLRAVLVLVSVLALVATACGDDDPDEAGGGDTGATGATGTTTGATGETATGGDDLLARIQEEGVIRVSTDPAYPPQSSLNEETGEYEGFDIDVATEIASRLGVEIQWETPAWDLMTAGHWNDRWDMSVGSMTVTPERAEVLHFSTAYYYTPAAVAVHVDNTTITDLETDLDGMRVGVCGACTYDFFLQGTLEIPGYEFDFIVDDPEIVTYDTDTTAIQDLSLGDGARLDAVISALPTLERAIDKDRPIKIVGDPVFAEPLAVAFDQSSELDAQSLVDAVSAIVEEMHADGTLTELSMTWFGTDLTIEA